jgi:hypothetical protein
MSMEYPKGFKDNVTNVFPCKNDFLKDVKWFKTNIFMRIFLYAHVHNSILQHLFGSCEFQKLWKLIWKSQFKTYFTKYPIIKDC